MMVIHKKGCMNSLFYVYEGFDFRLNVQVI
jgi:hypothetical protein